MTASSKQPRAVVVLQHPQVAITKADDDATMMMMMRKIKMIETGVVAVAFIHKWRKLH